MYKKLYRELMVLAQTEKRYKKSGIYYESHHIIPDYMFKNRKRPGPRGHLEGNPNSSANIVLLTFQEHLLAHYYLYEIMKSSRYEYSAGSALQFFFTHAIGDHARQRNLSEIDSKFLEEMDYLRQIGISSISKARSGKMPVVDSITGESMGSVEIDHPKVLSGEWQHHSKGKSGTKHSEGYGKGSLNHNFREMTSDHIDRIFKCVPKSIEDDLYFNSVLFAENLKIEFSEYKRLSHVWVLNNFQTFENLISEYNLKFGTQFIYKKRYRSKKVKEKYSNIVSGTKWVWSSATGAIKIKKDELMKYLSNGYVNGRGPKA